MATVIEPEGLGLRLRRARLVTTSAVAAGVLSGLAVAVRGLFVEPDPLWIVAGALGILAFTVALGGALYDVITTRPDAGIRRGLLVALACATVLSVPLVGPVGADRWQTWAFLGSTIVGSVPLLVRRWTTAVVACAAVLVVAAAVAWWVGGSVGNYLTITLVFGLSIAAWNGLHVWLWTFLVEAQEGRGALARLAATEERLRFARDVHDLLGHNLSVIAMKAELAARLAPVDAERASREATEAQRLAIAALAEMREVVHGYRKVDLRGHLAAVEQVLRSSGVRCTVVQPDGELPRDVADQLVPVLREASTNVLRHSRAEWCTIEIVREGNDVRMTVANDGARGTGPDRHSYGLRGLAERLADDGGRLRTDEDDGVFTLAVTVRVMS